ncbi:hypothetical protein T01_9834 [Trichinella spiralis]|uniref:Uncharacterized protein n=1 Tax=Trichinella spiralis TaxID=6334 RepID=A0A0V1C1A9_TRISP|nr:hypothetical protein T01_9834 [Trichinella spiralis]
MSRHYNKLHLTLLIRLGYVCLASYYKKRDLIRKAGAVCLERTGFQLTSMINNHDKALLSSRPDDAKI